MILDRIVEATKTRVAKEKELYPLEKIKAEVEKINIAEEEAFPFEKNISLGDINFICEIKKASPSKGIIVEDFPYEKIAKEYEIAGASAISVLTEPDFFKGSLEYLGKVARLVNIPVLRKDFIIDEYQIYQAKQYGAAAVLLICSILSDEELINFRVLADRLNLSCLVEAHDEEEVKRAIKIGARVIGVNNRNLKNFTVDINNSINLRKLVPEGIIFVSESGISNAKDIENLRKNNIQGVLIGESLMRSTNKVEKLQTLYGEIAKPVVKYCGLSKVEDIESVNKIKPDYIGFVFAPSKRQVDLSTAVTLASKLNPKIKKVGVFVEPTLKEIVAICKALCLYAVQIHGNYSDVALAELAKGLKEAGFAEIKLWRAFNISCEADLKKVELSHADKVLVDSHSEKALGGTGKMANWQILKKLSKPVILAGGLNRTNVLRGIRSLTPLGIDVSSGIESFPGNKDEELMKQLMDIIETGTGVASKG